MMIAVVWLTLYALLRFASCKEEWVMHVEEKKAADLETSGFFKNLKLVKKERVGKYVVYALQGAERSVYSATAEFDSATSYGEGLEISKNYAIFAGPGIAHHNRTADGISKEGTTRPTFAEKIAGTHIEKELEKSRKSKRYSVPHRYAAGKSRIEEEEEDNGGIEKNGDDVECRSEPSTRSSGYESGYFSWGIDRIDQRNRDLNRKACFYSSSSSLVPDDEIVDVYVLDTGVSNHPSFYRPVVYDYSYYGKDGRHSKDCNGHGTHVAGLVASRDYGVSPWNVQIRSVQTLNCDGDGDFASMTSALLWVKQHKSKSRRSIINMSLGSNGGASSSVSDLIRSLWYDDGVFVVVSSGNYGDDDCRVFPANVDGVISVGATDPYDRRAEFSNYGRCTDVFAPGTSIISCNYRNFKTGTILSGTSMSAPIVTGALANWMYYYGADVTSDALRTSFYGSFSANKVSPSTISPDTNNLIVYVGTAYDAGGSGGRGSGGEGRDDLGGGGGSWDPVNYDSGASSVDSNLTYVFVSLIAMRVALILVAELLGETFRLGDR
jgi:Subtilase family